MTNTDPSSSSLRREERHPEPQPHTGDPEVTRVTAAVDPSKAGSRDKSASMTLPTSRHQDTARPPEAWTRLMTCIQQTQSMWPYTRGLPESTPLPNALKRSSEGHLLKCELFHPVTGKERIINSRKSENLCTQILKSSALWRGWISLFQKSSTLIHLGVSFK